MKVERRGETDGVGVRVGRASLVIAFVMNDVEFTLRGGPIRDRDQ